MTISINKNTQLCMSLSARPGNFGTRFHNFLYSQLGLDYIYKAFTTKDLAAAIGGIRALGIRGCAVSMPFKEACIEFLDDLDPSAKAIDSVNTIVNTDGYLKAYNTDYLAVASLLRSHAVAPETAFALRGSGGMAKAVASALRDAGFRNGYIVARNQASGERLAAGCGYQWAASAEQLPVQMVVNVTPIGMSGGAEADELAFGAEQVAAVHTVFDVVAIPSETPLIQLGRKLGKSVITGLEVIAIQALEQFVLYTGVRPDAELVARAVEHARS